MEELYAIALERSTEVYSVRDPSDVSPARFDYIGTFKDFDIAQTVVNLLNRQTSWRKNIGLE